MVAGVPIGLILLQPDLGTAMVFVVITTGVLIVGGELRFHFLDWLGIGGWGGYSVGKLDTNLTKEIRDKGNTTNANRLDLPSREGYPNQIGRLNWWSGVELHFVPFRGKLAMFQKVFVDADIDVFVGAAFVGVEERANAVGQPAPGNVTFCEIAGNAMDAGCLESQGARSKRTAIAPSFGLAFNAFFKEFVVRDNQADVAELLGACQAQGILAVLETHHKVIDVPDQVGLAP